MKAIDLKTLATDERVKIMLNDLESASEERTIWALGDGKIGKCKKASK